MKISAFFNDAPLNGLNKYSVFRLGFITEKLLNSDQKVIFFLFFEKNIGKISIRQFLNEWISISGYMPHRDDFEDFDKDTEMLVAQIADKSVEDEDLDVALKLAQCDIYERRLREQVRRKRVARDYQLVSRFYRENPIVQIGFGAKFSPQKTYNQVKAKLKGDGPKQEIMEKMKGLTQFCTAQEYMNLIENLCIEKEMKVRIRELTKYRNVGISKQTELIPFEKLRFRRENKKKYKQNKSVGKKSSGTNTPTTNETSTFVQSKFLPKHGDYSLKALLDIDYESKEKTVIKTIKKRKNKSKWNKKKEKTGRRLLLKAGCILTIADPQGESTDDTS